MRLVTLFLIAAFAASTVNAAIKIDGSDYQQGPSLSAGDIQQNSGPTGFDYLSQYSNLVPSGSSQGGWGESPLISPADIFSQTNSNINNFTLQERDLLNNYANTMAGAINGNIDQNDPSVLNAMGDAGNTFYSNQGSNPDYQGAMNDVLRLGLSGAEAKTQNLANQLKAGLDLEKQVQNSYSDLQDQIGSAWPNGDDGSTKSFTYMQTVKDKDGNVTGMKEATEDLAYSEANAKLQGLEGDNKSIGDNTDMMKMNLQDAMQKQQQAMSILSNIVKMNHDTLKSTISNTHPFVFLNNQTNIDPSVPNPTVPEPTTLLLVLLALVAAPL
jgi:hypothetical protein